MLTHTKKFLRMRSMFLLVLLLAACTQQPTLDPEKFRYEGAMPANFSGSWERDYSRSEDVNMVLRRLYYQLSRRAQQKSSMDPRMSNADVSISSRDLYSIQALARMAEMITRPDVLTVSQSENEISVARKDDFAMLCSFYDGVSKGTESIYGNEICGWDGEQLISHLTLPGGLAVTHRFTVAADGNNMRVVTTVASTTSRLPFTLQHFYSKFERPSSEFNCIETLSRKRVCSTGKIDP